METAGEPFDIHRRDRAILIVSTILGSWLGMQMVHEFGHVTGAWMTGGRVSRVSLDPLGFSRTDLSPNPRPLAVAWSGPAFGALLPLVLGLVAVRLRMPGAFVVRFFAGFCLLVNGVYLAIGSFDRVGDCGDILRLGSTRWQLWLFGALAIPAAFACWHRQAKCFGFGKEGHPISRGVAVATLAVFLVLAVIGFAVGERP